MQTYKYNGHIDDYIKAINGDVIDCIDGTLLDDLLIISDGVYICALETYETANSSIYTIYKSDNKSDSTVIDLWYKRIDEREKQAQEIEEDYRRFKQIIERG